MHALACFGFAWSLRLACYPSFAHRCRVLPGNVSYLTQESMSEELSGSESGQIEVGDLAIPPPPPTPTVRPKAERGLTVQVSDLPQAGHFLAAEVYSGQLYLYQCKEVDWDQVCVGCRIARLKDLTLEVPRVPRCVPRAVCYCVFRARIDFCYIRTPPSARRSWRRDCSLCGVWPAPCCSTWRKVIVRQPSC